MVHAFDTPGKWSALSMRAIRSGKDSWSGVKCRQTGLSQVIWRKLAYQVAILGHWSFGLRTMSVSIMDGGAGSVAVSARPAFPVTRSTSGKAARTRSCACISRSASPRVRFRAWLPA